MRKIIEILRLKHEAGLSYSQIARSCSVSKSTVSDTLKRFQETGLPWPLPEDVDQQELENKLYDLLPKEKEVRPQPDVQQIHRELKRKNVTLQLLWDEYKAVHPNGYQYSYFCEIYQNWKAKLEPHLRQIHLAGEKLMVDFAGHTMPTVNPDTGEIKEAQIFVAVMAASNYTFARAAWSQDLYNWIDLHCRAFEFFGGVPEMLIPDNLRSAVSKICRYEPEINPTYQDMASHYNTAVIPARSGKPRDKAKAETGVQIVERWILARLRNVVFFSLSELNMAIEKLLIDLNERPFKKMVGCRKELFEELDKPALKPLPEKPYEFARWKTARVNIDYHVEIDYSFYSTPYQLVKEKVDVRITARTVEILYKGKRVASHPRSHKKGFYSTCPEHRPPSHQKYLEWTPSRILSWAQKAGTNTAILVKEIMGSRAHVEQSYRSCLGLLRLGEKYGQERLENACKRAIHYRAYTYRSVKSILEKGLDKVGVEEAELQPLEHQNIRGSNYYGGGE